MDFVEHTRDLNPEDLLAKNNSYHKSCYADIANTTKIERAKKRYRYSIEGGQPSVVKRKAGRPSSSTTQVEKDEPLTTRSKVEVQQKTMYYLSNHRSQKFNSRRVQGSWDTHAEGIRETCG